MPLFSKPPEREEQVKLIQAGDIELREKFLREHQGFVAAVVSGVLGGRSIDRDKDDEFSTGLLALNEALDRFNPEAGVSFLYFARQVITRRVIDSLRRSRRQNALVELVDTADGSDHPAMITPPATGQIEVKEDFIALAEKMRSFGFSMSDLVQNTPRHADSKRLAIKIGRTLAEDPGLMRHLLEKKTIPLKKLLQKVKVNPKTVERNRIYIITVALILASNLDTLKSYIYAVDEGSGRE